MATKTKTKSKPRELIGQSKTLSELGIKRFADPRQFNCRHIATIGHPRLNQCYSCWLRGRTFPQAEIQTDMLFGDEPITNN